MGRLPLAEMHRREANTSPRKSLHGPPACGRGAQEGGQHPSTEAHQGPLGAASRQAPHYRRERSDRAT
eukprot:12018874-Alexandrium_andersonii.AAC.1